MSDTTTDPATDLDPDPIPSWETPEGKAADAAREAAEAGGKPAEPTPAPEPEDPDPDPAVAAEPEAEESDEIKQQRRKMYEARVEAREARRQARVLQTELERRDREAANGGASELTQEQKYEIELNRRDAVRQFNTTCNAIYEKGVKDIPGFAKALEAYGEIGGLTPELVEAAQESGDAHHIIAFLARPENLDEAERISRLPPLRMGAAVAKIAAQVKPAPAKPKPVSRAPPPIRPIGGAARAEVDLDTVSMADYMRIQDAAEAKRYRSR